MFRQSKRHQLIAEVRLKKDFDTVCNSTILRKLQDKAQVFPLESEDYARTRLTHSIEVMSIAEGLGVHAINVIKNKNTNICKDTEKETDTIRLINEISLFLKQMPYCMIWEIRHLDI